MAPHWSRLCGLAAMAGGAVFAVTGILMALRPPGVEGGVPRDTAMLDEIMSVSLLLMVAGLVRARARDRAAFGKLGKTGAIIAGAGAGVAALSAVAVVVGLQALWVIGAVGLMLMPIGSLLVGLAALRESLLTPVANVLLVVGSLGFMLAFNTESVLAVMAAPFGAANVGLGYVRGSVPAGT